MHHLRKCLGGEVELGKAWNRPASRVVVIPYNYHLRVVKWDIVIFATGVDLSRKPQWYNHTRWVFANCYRIYALVPETALSVGEQLEIERWVGPAIYLRRQKTGIVHTHTYQATSIPGDRQHLSPLEQKRLAFWANRDRNQQIAVITDAFQHGDLPALWEKELLRNQPLDLFQRLPPLKLTVLVETAEHGRNLRALLPEWELLHGTEGRTTKGNNSIVTFTYAKTFGIDADLVIRSDGGCDDLDFKGLPPKARVRECMSLIDIFDRFDAKAEKAAERRGRHYRNRGWKPFPSHCPHAPAPAVSPPKASGVGHGQEVAEEKVTPTTSLPESYSGTVPSISRTEDGSRPTREEGIHSTAI